MSLHNSAIIIADDLTGANDTALQFFSKGCKTKVIIDYNSNLLEDDSVNVFAISTESRNVSKEKAVENVLEISEKLKESLNIDNYYKKIDSTLRGNAGVEILTLLETLGKDCAIVAPAYIEEGRTTIGGYQLLGGIVIERTQCALDPKAPIYESFIPGILTKDLNPQYGKLVDLIGLNIVTKGAGPVTQKINELIQNGKKIIIVDAMSTVDLKQIALAISKVSYDILPCGSAGLANAINEINNDTPSFMKHVDKVPSLPRLIISGSATQLTLKQIQKLKEEKPDIKFIDLTIKNIIDGATCELIDEITQSLNKGQDVVIHSSLLSNELKDEELSSQLIDEAIAQVDFPNRITDFLSELLFEVNIISNSILITIGGETSYKCATKIKSDYLEIIDTIQSAIPLCMDANAKIIVTKSGNFGNQNTLVEIVNYLDRLKDV